LSRGTYSNGLPEWPIRGNDVLKKNRSLGRGPLNDAPAGIILISEEKGGGRLKALYPQKKKAKGIEIDMTLRFRKTPHCPKGSRCRKERKVAGIGKSQEQEGKKFSR